MTIAGRFGKFSGIDASTDLSSPIQQGHPGATQFKVAQDMYTYNGSDTALPNNLSLANGDVVKAYLITSDDAGNQMTWFHPQKYLTDNVDPNIFQYVMPSDQFTTYGLNSDNSNSNSSSGGGSGDGGSGSGGGSAPSTNGNASITPTGVGIAPILGIVPIGTLTPHASDGQPQKKQGGVLSSPSGTLPTAPIGISPTGKAIATGGGKLPTATAGGVTFTPVGTGGKTLGIPKTGATTGGLTGSGSSTPLGTGGKLVGTLSTPNGSSKPTNGGAIKPIGSTKPGISVKGVIASSKNKKASNAAGDGTSTDGGGFGVDTTDPFFSTTPTDSGAATDSGSSSPTVWQNIGDSLSNNSAAILTAGINAISGKPSTSSTKVTAPVTKKSNVTLYVVIFLVIAGAATAIYFVNKKK